MPRSSLEQSLWGAHTVNSVFLDLLEEQSPVLFWADHSAARLRRLLHLGWCEISCLSEGVSQKLCGDVPSLHGCCHTCIVPCCTEKTLLREPQQMGRHVLAVGQPVTVFLQLRSFLSRGWHQKTNLGLLRAKATPGL